MEKPNESADGKFVVIQNGQRVTTPTTNQTEAQKEADRLNRLSESTPGAKNENAQAKVKQNLMG